MAHPCASFNLSLRVARAAAADEDGVSRRLCETVAEVAAH
jgi:hypothetical protein